MGGVYPKLYQSLRLDEFRVAVIERARYGSRIRFLGLRLRRAKKNYHSMLVATTGLELSGSLFRFGRGSSATSNGPTLGQPMQMLLGPVEFEMQSGLA